MVPLAVVDEVGREGLVVVEHCPDVTTGGGVESLGQDARPGGGVRAPAASSPRDEDREERSWLALIKGSVQAHHHWQRLVRPSLSCLMATHFPRATLQASMARQPEAMSSGGGPAAAAGCWAGCAP